MALCLRQAYDYWQDQPGLFISGLSTSVTMATTDAERLAGALRAAWAEANAALRDREAGAADVFARNSSRAPYGPSRCCYHVLPCGPWGLSFRPQGSKHRPFENKRINTVILHSEKGKRVRSDHFLGQFQAFLEQFQTVFWIRLFRCLFLLGNHFHPFTSFPRGIAPLREAAALRNALHAEEEPRIRSHRAAEVYTQSPC